jgi:hypothetical protein
VKEESEKGNLAQQEEDSLRCVGLVWFGCYDDLLSLVQSKASETMILILINKKLGDISQVRR